MSYSRSGTISASIAALTVVVSGLPAAGQPACAELVAEKTLSVGRVCVTERADSLFVRFESAGAWRLAETHLAIAASLEGIPLAGGRQPILGRFPYKDSHVPRVTEFVYAVPMGVPPGGSGGTLVIAAHATVVGEGREEGAWAKGPAFATEGNPATYFLYRRSQSAKPFL